ncbi:hypothetical protein [Cupriavidus necator]|uniref:Uncharacterized protein n=1 Tax=Cupriavidus pinatubonensis (strain JMP 134 / LMG 1197) TaxID=264198 RepID=Q46NJ9_CUPPJ|nr:hypothetical protein [Cupriavidus necator]
MTDRFDAHARELVAGISWYNCLGEEQRLVWLNKGAALFGERTCVTAWRALKAERPQTAQRIVTAANPVEVRLVAQILRLD